jgi:hypothetical protein
MKRRAFLGLALALRAGAQTSESFGEPTAPSFEQVQLRLTAWQRDHPHLLRLGVPGESIEGRPIYAATLTDSNVPNEDKQRILITALHAGQEHSGATSVLYLMDWLLGGDLLAREILRRQIVVCMPIVNPDSYVNPNTTGGLANARGRDPYADWTVDGPRDPANCPEAVAVKKVMDETQAEVHADIHGNSLPYPGVYQIESTGRAYSNITLRPYHHEVIRLMDEAALKEGYPSDQLEEDAERLFGADGLGIETERLWAGVRTPAGGGVVQSKPRVYAAIYGYNRYHTMPLASECGWERSAFLRHRRLLQIGNAVWPGEHDRGYPVRVIMKVGYHMVTAYGTTAAEQRRSRIELWNRQRQISHGINRPLKVGRLMYVCATSNAARKKWLTDKSLAAFSERMAEHPNMHGDRIREFVQGFPAGPGQWGPTSNVMMQGGAADPSQEGAIEHGLAFRLRIPFPKARDLELWMNGAKLRSSNTDGYLVWKARGFTNVQINIPPARSNREDLFVVTCTYDPGEHRRHGLIGPPEAE